MIITVVFSATQILQNFEDADMIGNMTCDEFEGYEDNPWIQQVINDKEEKCKFEKLYAMIEELKK
jgi:hypothetical protein